MKKKLWIYVLTLMMLFLVVPMALGNSCGYFRRWKKVTIIRDNYGVPHVFANTKEELGFGAGYAMAQDRLWQADLYRKQRVAVEAVANAIQDMEQKARTVAKTK